MSNDSPIVLNASVSVDRGNGGVDVDLAAMQSTSRNWLKITELRVFIDPGESIDNQVYALNGGPTDLGFMVDVAISCGGEDLTTGFIGTDAHPTGERIAYIPAFLLGPRIYRRFSTIPNSQLNFGVDTAIASQNAYTWTFPRPLYVPPNTPIKFKVRRTSSVASLDLAAFYPVAFNVEVSAVGLKLANKPNLASRCIPHLHGWSPRNANSQRVESGEAFRNLHREPLNLTRLLGGTALYFGTSIDSGAYFQQGAAGAGQTITDPTLIQIYDANNNDVVVPMSPVPLSAANPQAKVPLSALFLAKTNSLRISDKLLANQAYRMIVSPVVASTGGVPTSLNLPMLAIESYREI